MPTTPSRCRRLLLALVALGPSTATGQSVPDSLHLRTDSVFTDWNRSDAPGCVCGVMHDGGLAYAKGYGMANLELGVPLGAASVFYIASTSKQFTAAAIALLALDGALDLDADIHTYLPEMGDLGAPVTVRQLVHHTSGLRDYFGLMSLNGWTGEYFNNERVYELLTRQRALNFPPGTRYLYSNSNYVLMAEIVRRVSGQTLRAFAEARIFGPLGMRHTLVDDDFHQIVPNRVMSYNREDGQYRREPKAFDGFGDGNVLTTVADLQRWDENFWHPEVGGQALLDLMLTRGVLASGDTINYAFGVGHGTYRGLPTVDHGGAFLGFRTQLLRFPTEHFSVAVLCNAGNANPTALARRVADVWLAGQLAPVPERAARAPLDTITLPPAVLERFTGVYWNDADQVARTVVLRDGALIYQRGPGAEDPLAARRDSSFVVLGIDAEVIVRFTEGQGDAPLQLSATVNGGSPFVARKLAPFVPDAQVLRGYAGRYVNAELDAPLEVGVSGDTLTITGRHNPPLVLRALTRDLFTGEGFTISFTRRRGSVVGFTLDAGRVLGVAYTRSRP
jgi:CubicO group peptidase (beta-lactamase class C family)